jgi:hypothetical protein
MSKPSRSVDEWVRIFMKKLKQKDLIHVHGKIAYNRMELMNEGLYYQLLQT